ncbi:hypothetical protein QFC21_006988 [Naganishia friedmannii]|uniref:Uncharacterized protein n=1 Tax=Naganishia friedmannii TaxID=89922 RepID=A0ACC2UYU3_9TREE|nr:hypothetical protein QFC21_006988 [Naganishia friedmannii]
MPPLKVKTNLPNARSAAAPYDAALNKNQLNVGKETKAAKTTNRTTKTGAATKSIVQASRKKVEVEILLGDVDGIDDEADELLKDEAKRGSKDGRRNRPESAAFTIQHGNQHHSRLASIPPRSDTPAGDTGYWSGNEYAAPDEEKESIDSLIDDLLKPKNRKNATTLKHAVDNVPIQGKGEAAHKLDKAASNTTAPGKIGDKCGEGNDTVSDKQSSKDTTLHARLPDEPISPDHFDLAHTIVIKVLEHGLKKNVDWFTMAKELEGAGLTTAKKTKAARGKGKAKGKKTVDEDELESEDAASKPAKISKVDVSSSGIA